MVMNVMDTGKLSVLESHNQATLSSVGKREKVYISDIQIEKPRISRI